MTNLILISEYFLSIQCNENLVYSLYNTKSMKYLIEIYYMFITGVNSKKLELIYPDFCRDCNCIIDSIDNPISENNVFFVDSLGGASETFLYKHC